MFSQNCRNAPPSTNPRVRGLLLILFVALAFRGVLLAHCLRGGGVRILLGFTLIAFGLTGTGAHPEKKLIIAEAIPQSASPFEIRYSILKGDREPRQQKQEPEQAADQGTVQLDEILVAPAPSAPLSRPVRLSYFVPPALSDDETLRLSLDPESYRSGAVAASSGDIFVDPIAHDRNLPKTRLLASANPDDPVAFGPNENADASPPLSKEEICNALSENAQANRLPAVYFANLIWQESRFRHDAVSPVGALGVAQFMPEVALEAGIDDPFDPMQAIPASARLLRDLRQQFGNLGLAAAAYNAGPHRVRAWLKKRRKLPRETRTYVLRVTGHPVEQWRPARPRLLAFVPAQQLPCRDMPVFAQLQQKETAKQDDASPRIAHNSAAVRSHQHVKSGSVRVAIKTSDRTVARDGHSNGAKTQKVQIKPAVAKVAKVATQAVQIGAPAPAAHRKPDAKRNARKVPKSGRVKLAART
jgi:soluble lytic murein transglycosylase-like protein